MTLVEVGRSLSQTGQAVETALEAGCADDMPEVYKLPMVRMSLMTDEIPNVRV